MDDGEERAERRRRKLTLRRKPRQLSVEQKRGEVPRRVFEMCAALALSMGERKSVFETKAALLQKALHR